MHTVVRELAELRERLVRSIVANLAPMLAPHANDTLYVLALTTDSDVMTLRLTAHTEEALKALLTQAEATPEDTEYYRWWPDEWQLTADDPNPHPAPEDDRPTPEATHPEPNTDHPAPDTGHPEPDTEAPSLITCNKELAALMETAPNHDQWRTQARTMLNEALADPRIPTRLREINPTWHPVRYVTDTDGDMAPTVHSIEELNKTHPNPQLVATAHTYFTDEA